MPQATETGKQMDALADSRNLNYLTLLVLSLGFACHLVEAVIWLRQCSEGREPFNIGKVFQL